ncbi:MAG: Na+:solute symporter, partial [bacterium]|nr:Na+:solute symporter [bacterium]
MRGLSGLDIGIIVGFLASVIVIGAWAAKRASKSAEDFFLSGRSMPWWLLGVSMVACTFSCDTPNLVTDLVRTQGVAGNWAWWAFLLTGMLTVFVYAKLWRRSALSTDLGFYEIRYAGAPAKALRGFRAVYLGLVFNVIIMGTVSLAAIKIGATIFGLSPATTLAVALVSVGVYATLGGLTGSIWADFYQYAVAMLGAVAAAYFAVKMCGPDGSGTLAALFKNPAVAAKMSLFPAVSGPGWKSTLMTVLVLPVAVQWWATWYPGAEPGGGGYIAQRMLSAKDERNAVGAVMLFNFLHYALRSWPWLIVALASLVVFPDVASLQAAFPDAAAQFVKDDMAYPAMVS